MCARCGHLTWLTNPLFNCTCANWLRTLLGLNSDWLVCGEAVNGADAVVKAHQLAPDIILMDFSMPQMDGVETAREIPQSGTDIPILLFTLHLSPRIILVVEDDVEKGSVDFKLTVIANEAQLSEPVHEEIMYTSSAELRAWCERNRNRYVPE
jgi:CheY-like chemotaxis protein